jgi:nitrate/TMAO reductase-like tetraheme cytochrome c subunit
MMKTTLIGIAVLGMMGWHAGALAGDVAGQAEVCIDCHELEEFKGMDAAALAAGVETGNANSKMMAKALADVSPEDLQAIVDHLAAEANK